MAIREVLTSFTFEQQRQMINLIGTDVGDASTLLTPTNVLVSGINEIVNGDVDLVNQTHGMDAGSLASPSLYWDAGQGFYKVDANKIGLSTGLAIAGNLEVDGDITFRAGAGSGGTLTFGDLNTDNIVFNAELTSSIVPDSTANYNLGSATKQWNNIWVDGTASIDTLTVDENSTFTGYLQVDSGDVRVPNTQTTVDLFDDYATTVEAFGAGTDIRLGATTGTLTLRNPAILGSETTQDLFNTVATTVNAFGAATTINMGIAGGGGNTNFNVLSDDMNLSGKIAVNGGELLSSENTFNLLINNNDVIIGNSGGVGTTTFNTKIVAKQSLEFTNTSNNYIYIPDNEVSALHIRKTGSSIDWMQFRTDTGNERVVVWKDLYIVGNLDISGTTTTIDSTTLTVEDKNIELGNVSAPSDTTADGGGITLKGATDKTIAYSNSTGMWESNIGLKVTGSIDVGGLTVDANLTPTSGTSVELFYSVNGGIIQAFDRDNNNLEPLQVRGSTWSLSLDGSASFEGSSVTVGNADQVNITDSSIYLKDTGSASSSNYNVKLDTNGSAVFTGTVSDSLGPVRRVKVDPASTGFTLTAAYAGQLIRQSGSGQTINFPNGVFSAGDMVSFFNVGTGTLIITAAGTMYNTADAATGTRTIGAKGMATVICTASNEFAISGTQLT